MNRLSTPEGFTRQNRKYTFWKCPLQPFQILSRKSFSLFLIFYVLHAKKAYFKTCFKFYSLQYAKQKQCSLTCTKRHYLNFVHNLFKYILKKLKKGAKLVNDTHKKRSKTGKKESFIYERMEGLKVEKKIRRRKRSY